MPYNSVADADSYFDARYGYTKWGVLTTANKEAALVSANQILDLLCQWSGEKTDENQENEFPRDGESEAPEAVKVSELEIAYAIVDTGSTSTDAGDSVEKLKAGSVELGFKVTAKAGNPLVNDTVKTLLSPYGNCDFNMGGGSTQTIPVYRG